MNKSPQSPSEDSKAEILDSALPSPLCIVEFSNGNVKLGSGKKLQFRSFRSADLNSESRKNRIIVASNQRLEYRGSNYESEMSKITSSLLKVGVYNKNTKKIKLYDADFFHLRPVIKYESDTKTSFEKSYKEKAEDLALAFGSKNIQKAVTSRLKYEATGNDTNVATISTEFIASQLIKKEKVDGVNPSQTSEAIPPQNKNATSPDAVYNIFDIISSEEFVALDSQADMFVKANHEEVQIWKREKKYCAFMIHCLEMNIRNLSLDKAKLLCYMDYMICLLKKSFKDLRKKDPAPEIPQPFKRKLMEKYLVNNRMPPRMKDKLLAHAMVLALTVANYIIDGTLWAHSTCIPWKRLTLVAYALGCHVSERKNQDTNLILLKLPLYKFEPKKRFNK